MYLASGCRPETLAVWRQVGVVSLGQQFPFWVRGQSVLTLTVAAAAPEHVVRLARGLELSVAPRPRRRPQATRPATDPGSADSDALPAIPAAWLRLQVLSPASLAVLMHPHLGHGCFP